MNNNAVKFLFAFLLLVSFVVFLSFGFLSMHAGAQNHFSDCLAAIAGGVCPEGAGLLEYAVFHLDAYNNFALATLSENTVGAWLFLFLLLLSAILLLPRLFRFPLLCLRRSADSPPFPQKQQFSHWLALHENSPTAC